MLPVAAASGPSRSTTSVHPVPVGWTFTDPGVGIALCDLRGDLWRALHGDGNRDEALALLRQQPELAYGASREWTDAQQVLERHQGPQRPQDTTLSRETQARIDRVNEDAALGLRILDEPPIEQPDLPLSFDGARWLWCPTGHWLLEAMMFGDLQEVKDLLDAGLDPNVEVPGATGSATRLNAWSYCLSLVLMGNAELAETGIGGSPEHIRATAETLLETFLLHGLNPQSPVIVGGEVVGTRWEQVNRWATRDPEWPRARRWLQAMEQYALRQALPPPSLIVPSPQRSRL